MREKIMNLPKTAVACIGILAAAAFLGLSDLASMLLSRFLVLPGYGNSMIAEFISGVIALVMLLLSGYHTVSISRKQYDSRTVTAVLER